MFYKDIKEWPKEEREVVRSIEDTPKKIKIFNYKLDDNFNIYISENSQIHDFANIGNRCIIEGNLGECTVDDDSYIGAAVTLNDGIYIGRGCNIAGQVFSDIQEKTVVKESGYIGYNCVIGKSVSVAFKTIIEDGCTIGDYVRFGVGSVAHEGVSIGKNCKIGMSSEIFKNVGNENNIQSYVKINAEIGEDNFIENNCIVNCKIGNGNKISSNCIIDASIGDNNYIHMGKKIETSVYDYEDIE